MANGMVMVQLNIKMVTSLLATSRKARSMVKVYTPGKMENIIPGNSVMENVRERECMFSQMSAHYTVNSTTMS